MNTTVPRMWSGRSRSTEGLPSQWVLKKSTTDSDEDAATLDKLYYYLIESCNWRRLVGTSLYWLLLDHILSRLMSNKTSTTVVPAASLDRWGVVWACWFPLKCAFLGIELSSSNALVKTWADSARPVGRSACWFLLDCAFFSTGIGTSTKPANPWTAMKKGPAVRSACWFLLDCAFSGLGINNLVSEAEPRDHSGLPTWFDMQLLSWLQNCATGASSLACSDLEKWTLTDSVVCSSDTYDVLKLDNNYLVKHLDTPNSLAYSPAWLDTPTLSGTFAWSYTSAWSDTPAFLGKYAWETLVAVYVGSVAGAVLFLFFGGFGQIKRHTSGPRPSYWKLLFLLPTVSRDRLQFRFFTIGQAH